MDQSTTLNQSGQPARQQQQTAVPVSLASGGDVAALAGRVAAIEAWFTSLADYADDAAAAAGGVAIGGFYLTGSALMQRQT